MKQIFQQFNDQRSPQDIELEAKFKKIANNKIHFEMDHINQLNLDYKILFMIGKKNIGKSYQIHQMLLKIKDDPKEKFIYGRFQKTHLNAIALDWNSRPDWPYQVDRSSYDVYLKEYNEITNSYEIDKAKKQPKGLFVALSTLGDTNSIKSDGFEGYNTIIFDEFIPNNSAKLNEKIFTNFNVFISDIERHKPNLKVYIFANNKGNNYFFEAMQIDSNTTIRYAANILFINSKDFYKGVENQETTNAFLHFSQKQKDHLLNNTQPTLSERQLTNPAVIDQFYDRFAFMNEGVLYRLLQLDLSIQGLSTTCYYIKRTHPDQNTINYLSANKVKLFSFKLGDVNNFDDCILLTDIYRDRFSQYVSSILKTKRLFFYDISHLTEFISLFDKRKNLHLN